MSHWKTWCGSILLMACLLLTAQSAFARSESTVQAEKLMTWQLDAVTATDFHKFIANGNRAFRQLMDEYTFDSTRMQRQAKLKKGYRLEYLGAIRRLGMDEHLWRIHIKGDKYQLLGSLSIAQGKVVGFNLD